MVVQEGEVAAQNREEFRAQKRPSRHPLVIVATAVMVRAIHFRVRKLFLKPAEQLLMAHMHAESDLRLLAISPKMALANEHSDQEPFLKRIEFAHCEPL